MNMDIVKYTLLYFGKRSSNDLHYVKGVMSFHVQREHATENLFQR